MSTNPYSSPSPLADPTGYAVPGKQQTPVAGTVLGILNILYGLSVFLCLGAMSVYLFVAFTAEAAEGDAALQLMQENAFVKFYHYTSLLLSMLTGLCYIGAGVGLLMLRPFGRRLSIGLASIELAQLAVSLAVNCIFLFPIFVRQIERVPSGSPEQITAISSLVSGLAGIAISTIYPAVVLFVMYRKSMVAAYGAKHDQI